VQLSASIRSALTEEFLAPRAAELVGLSAETLRQSVSALALRQDEVWRAGLAALEEAFRRNLPENWQDIDSSLLDVIEMIKQSGICLVWAPRGELVLQLISAGSNTEREAVLAAVGDTVITDLGAAMATVGTVKLAGFEEASGFARDAIAAARDGHMAAAQSLAACGLEPAVRLSFGMSDLAAIRRDFETRNVDEVTGMLMKVTLLQMCTAKALTQFHRGDALPDGFNRHATQHGVRDCFSDANALAGMLLLVGWLREFRWFADHHPQMFRAGT